MLFYHYRLVSLSVCVWLTLQTKSLIRRKKSAKLTFTFTLLPRFLVMYFFPSFSKLRAECTAEFVHQCGMFAFFYRCSVLFWFLVQSCLENSQVESWKQQQPSPAKNRQAGRKREKMFDDLPILLLFLFLLCCRCDHGLFTGIFCPHSFVLTAVLTEFESSSFLYNMHFLSLPLEFSLSLSLSLFLLPETTLQAMWISSSNLTAKLILTILQMPPPLLLLCCTKSTQRKWEWETMKQMLVKREKKRGEIMCAN